MIDILTEAQRETVEMIREDLQHRRRKFQDPEAEKAVLDLLSIIDSLPKQYTEVDIKHGLYNLLESDENKKFTSLLTAGEIDALEAGAIWCARFLGVLKE